MKHLRWAIKREWESKYIDTHLRGKCITYNGSNSVYVYESLHFTAHRFTHEHYDENEG